MEWERENGRPRLLSWLLWLWVGVAGSGLMGSSHACSSGWNSWRKWTRERWLWPRRWGEFLATVCVSCLILDFIKGVLASTRIETYSGLWFSSFKATREVLTCYNNYKLRCEDKPSVIFDVDDVWNGWLVSESSEEEKFSRGESYRWYLTDYGQPPTRTVT